jgi:hypothetical protein
MLERIMPQEISAEDFELLIKADAHNPGHCHIPPDELVTKLWAGIFELWRFEDGSGIVLAEKAGDRLNLVRLCGKSIAFRFNEITEILQHRARELNCTSIETMVYSDKLVKALERIGARQEAVNMVLELDNG